MSAASLIVRGDKAIILSDSAHYHCDGTIMALRSKVVACSRLRVALTTSGLASEDAGRLIADRMKQHSDLDVMLADLPAIASALEHQVLTDLAAWDEWPCGPLPTFVQLFVACYSRRRRRPEAWIVGSQQGTFGEGYEPLTLRQVQQVLSPPVDRSLCPEGGFAPLRDGRAILEAQRLVPHASGTFNVGGWGEITIVGRDGVTVRRVCDWPDVVGEKVRQVDGSGGPGDILPPNVEAGMSEASTTSRVGAHGRGLAL